MFQSVIVRSVGDCRRVVCYLRQPGSTMLAVMVLLLALPCSGLSAVQVESSERPNIILIMTDDQGYWDTGVTGNPHIDTPHMDQLATTGMQFQRYYVAPVCSLTL